MVDVASHLRDSGFSDDEIGAWAKTTRENLTAAGFKDEEVDDYLGIPKTPKSVPAALLERMQAGKALTDFYSKVVAAVPEAKKVFSEMHPDAVGLTSAVVGGFNEGFGAEQPGINEEELYKTLGIPAPVGGAIVTGTPGLNALRSGAAALDIMMRATNGGIRAVAEAAGYIGEKAGQEQGVNERMKRDINSLGQVTLMLAGAMHPTSPASQVRLRGPGGAPEVQTIGGLPKGEDFSNAGTLIGHGDTTPAMEGKLQDLYESKGIHPAEVAHDAQTDVTITQSILSTDKADMPAAYGEAPKDTAVDILNERQPSEAGAAKPPSFDERIAALDREKETSPDVKHGSDDPYSNALASATGPGLSDVNQLTRHVEWSLENGRPDIAEVIIQRAEQAAERAKEAKPGVDPANAERYERVKNNLAKKAEEAEQDAQWLRKMLPDGPPVERGTATDILNERQPSSAGAAAVKPPTYSDAQSQVLSKISVDEKAPTAKLTWDKLYTNTMDKLFPLAKAVKASGETLAAEENPYQLARLLSGSAGKADHFLNNGTFDFHTYENNGVSLKQILSPVKDDLNGFRAYMASARALELEGRGIKSGFDAGEAPSAPPLISAGLDAPRTVVIEGREKFAKPLLELVDYQNRVAAYARDAGVISEAGFKAMTQANQLYVPFSRVMGLDEGAFIRGGGSSLQAKNPVKSITGSARDIIDPLESIIRNTHIMVEMAERNVVGTKLVDMLKRMEGEMPDLPKAAADVVVKDTARAAAIADELGAVGVKNAEELAAALDHATAPLKEGEIAILRDGKRETYQVDPDLAKVMKGLDAQSMSLFERVLAAPASLLRAGAVLTPQFWARHIMRDYLYATATSTPERGLFTPWDMAKGLSGLIMKDADYWNWLKSGGANVATASMDRQYLQENLRKLTGETGLVGRAWNVLADPEASMWQKTASVGTLPFQAIEKFMIDPLRAGTRIAEEASHLAAFKKGMRAQEAAEEAPTNLRDQIIRAGWASRDTAVDAARMGASMRAYNQIISFGNIKLQDTDRVVRAFKDNPITATALITGAITVPSIILWSLNQDDPDYQELPQWEKDFFFIVPVGTAAPSPLHIAQAQARGEEPKPSTAMFLRLPKPWAMGMIFGSGVERMLEAYKGHNPEPFREFGKHIWETSGPDFVPTAAAPIINQFANRSTFTNRTLIPAAQEKFLPEYQYTPYTTELTKEIGKIIGAFPGISQLKMDNSGWGGTAKAITSPILMENYVRGWTGTLGMYALQAADKSLRAAGVLPDPPKPASTLADIPVIQAFVVRYPSATTESVQKFQDDYEQAQKFMTTWQAMAKDGNVAAMQHIQDMADTHMLEQLDGFHQAIGNLNQMVRLVYKNPDIPADEKRQLIDQLYFGIIQTAQGGEHAIHAIREKAADVVSTRH